MGPQEGPQPCPRAALQPPVTCPCRGGGVVGPAGFSGVASARAVAWPLSVPCMLVD